MASLVKRRILTAASLVQVLRLCTLIAVSLAASHPQCRVRGTQWGPAPTTCAICAARCPLGLECGHVVPATIPELKAEVASLDQDNGEYQSSILAIYYAAWCPYSKQAWETYLSAARRFPSLRAVAIDVSFSPGFTLQHGIAGIPTVAVATHRRMRHVGASMDLESLVSFVENATMCRAELNHTDTSDLEEFRPMWEEPGDDWALVACAIAVGCFMLLYAVPSFRAWHKEHRMLM